MLFLEKKWYTLLLKKENPTIRNSLDTNLALLGEELVFVSSLERGGQYQCEGY